MSSVANLELVLRVSKFHWWTNGGQRYFQDISLVYHSDYHYFCAMKKYITILFAVFFCFSCSQRQTHPNGSFWQPLQPDFDSIALCLENAFLDLEPDSVKDSLLTVLSDVSTRYPHHRQLQARLHFWKARYYARVSHEDIALKELKLARSLTDSSAFPYDLARIKYEENSMLTTNPVAQYTADREALEYFSAIGDSINIAAVYMNLGATFRNMLDTTRYLDYFKRADDILQKKGMKKLRLLNLLNLTDMYGPEKADSMLALVRDAPEIEHVQSLYLIALYNSYLYTDSIKHLQKLYSIIKDKPEHAPGQCHVQALMAIHNLDRGIDIPSSLSLAHNAWDSLRPEYPLVMQAKATEAIAKALKAEDLMDSGFRMLERSHKLYIDYLNQHRSNNVLSRESEISIRNAEIEYEKKRQLDRAWFWVIVASIAALAAVIGGILYIRWKNACIKHERSEMELTRDRYQLAASQLVMEGKDKAIQSVMHMVSDMKKQGKVSPSDANEISSSLRSYLSGKEELDTFQDIYRKLNPNFSKLLIERCPTLSEGQIKLASYIAMGMTNRQISQMLLIDYRSVIKSRYRLRAKLGLDRSTSLETMLRSISEEAGS